MFCSRKRYIIATVVLTSAFWLALEVVILIYTSHLGNEDRDIHQGKSRSARRHSWRLNDTNTKLITIEEFKSLYPNTIHFTSKQGENGIKVYNSPSEKEIEQQQFRMYQFNELSSSKISLLREIPDNRPKS